ncbi:MAG TPA: hypothetical protein VK076_06930 [Candidatus Sphingobacterium stercoripullorum]|nr:hypothetical protein [Candidatus Sphingobacterium stercoripullorum]
MNKQLVKENCVEFLAQKLHEVKSAIEGIQEGIQQESKSSAGDKYETSREMLQQDLNRLLTQKSVIENDLSVLNSIRNENSLQAALGSLLEISSGECFFIAVGIGKVPGLKKDCFAISVSSPLAKLILGKKKGDSFLFKNKKVTIVKLQ